MATSKSYPYDVALSYAGEDRVYAEKLADALKLRGVKVFYDKYQKSNLWGKNLYTHLSDLYQNQALYCVMFLSKFYVDKVWTNREREAAQARAMSENREYILPIRLDNTEIPGILSTISYLDLHEETPDSVADMILEKLKIFQVTPIQAYENEVPSNVSPDLTKSETVFNPEPLPLEPLPVSVQRHNVLLGSELGTPMRRPVVRLQPMLQKSAEDSNQRNKERLLKGYQLQLAGFYDDAMQEYSVIIRNAPELLGDIISNLRALNKLAPRYAASYRVLGNAYMRQGEYLQAMDAYNKYNKALTMAKKAKSK